MKEKKINQILKNQKELMSMITWIYSKIGDKKTADDLLVKDLNKRYWETYYLLNPEEKQTLPDKTKFALQKHGE